MRNRLEQYLQKIGYEKVATNLPELSLFFQRNTNSVEVLSVIEDRPGLYLTMDQYIHIKQQAEKLFVDRGYTSVHIMTLVLADDFEKIKMLSQEDRFCWMIDRNRRSLVVYENQTDDFYGLRNHLERFLDELPEDLEKIDHRDMNVQYRTKEKKVKNEWTKYVTISNLIILINLLIFALCTFTGDLLYNIGVLRLDRLLINKEYYRLLTSVFLHADMEHILGNMLILYMAGKFVEKILGSVRFTILYLLSGIGGNILSLYMQNQMGEFYSSLGASGAVFGVLGALLVFVLLRHKEVQIITVPRLMFYLLYSIYIGARATNIDNYAHIGGMLTGIIFAFLLWLTVKKRRETK